MNQPRQIETASNSVSQYKGGITIKSSQEREAMRRAGAIVGAVLGILKAAVEPGITTKDLDNIAYREITRRGGTPTFKGYRGFPASICTSVNEEIVHGIPGNRVLKEGDVVKMDVGATLEGFIGDAAISVPVGEVSEEYLKLIEATRLSLEAGIRASQPGNRIGDIGAAVQEYGESRGYGVVREYVGHGVGQFILHVRHHMGIQIQCDANLGVSQGLRHNLRVDVLLQRQGGEGVAQPMEHRLPADAYNLAGPPVPVARRLPAGFQRRLYRRATVAPGRSPSMRSVLFPLAN